MGLESRIHDALMCAPAVKKTVKRVYQGASVIASRPKKSEGKITRVTPDDEFEYLFGYYDKSPWDASGRYMLCLRVKDASKNVAPGDEAEIVLIDTEKDNTVKVIAKTCTWNVQQGCMAGWLGPSFENEIFYNDLRDGQYHGILLNIKTGEERLLEMPVYSVSNDGKTALSLDFSRLHRLRPGYGYSNLEDKTADKMVPKGPCVWRIDMKTGKAKPILTYLELYDFEHRVDMEGAEHKVNHLMLSPNGKRFMVIHRWLNGGKKTSRLLTCDIDGKDLYNLSDDDMVSHCYWKNNQEILAYCRKNGANGYYLMRDKTKEFERKWDFLSSDGHPSYSPDGSLVVTDTYPNRKRICTIRVLSDTTSTIIAKVYAPFKYDNDTRCDLHPRWSRDGKMVCFDGCFEGKREVYVVDVEKFVNKNGERLGQRITKNGRTKVLFMLNSCKDRGPTRVVYNIIKNLDYTKFEPVLLTLSEENEESNINEILPYVSSYEFCKTSKKDILLGKTDKLKKAIEQISPNVIHTTGVFPDYTISKISKYNQVITLHNYAPFDYVSKFGRIKGWLLVKLQYYAAKNAKKTLTCSKSLADLYAQSGFKYDYIRNGIDVDKFKVCKDKTKLRSRLGLNPGSFIFIYTGQFVKGKNIDFALSCFVKKCNNNNDKIFVLLGDGPELKVLQNKYSDYQNILFMGKVSNVNDYLCASDVYVSASRSEGLPNGVLEAIASGLPVLLSDIPQHEEILESGNKCGYSFSLNDKRQLVGLMKKIVDDSELKDLAKNARKTAEEYFSSCRMSERYQETYEDIALNCRITLFIGSLSGGGAERVTCNLANYLNENGYKVDVITMSNARDTYKLDDGVNRINLLDKMERAGNMYNLKLRKRRLKEYVVKNQDVSCYVVMLPITIYLLIRLKRFTKSKMIISERNTPDSYKLYDKIIMKYACKKCDGLVVQTKEIGEWYKNIENKVVIPNAINKDIVFPKRSVVEKKIVSVSRLEKQKNIPMLIEGFAEFNKNHPDYVLEIYGKGSLENELRKIAKKRKLDDKIIFMGYVDNVAERIANAACFVLTSNHEGMPNALIEAMCIGIPCIATDCDGGGVRELIKNGENGIIIKKNDAEGLVRALEIIIDNDNMSQSYSSESVRLRNVLSCETIYNKWENYIINVCRGAVDEK